MSSVYPALPKLTVRDSVDDDDLTDIDDEVFIRDGKNDTLKLDDEGGVKRPLMAPRRKCKKPCNLEGHKFPCKALLVPFCYGLVALIVLIGLIILYIVTANLFPMPLTILKNWLSHELKGTINKSDIIPCTSLTTKIIWTRSLPKLTSEAPLRSNDVNGDGTEDIIVGFSTGLDTIDAPDYICTLYFGSQMPCLGGILALDGKTGETIWTHWTAHAIFSVDCGLDLTNDKIKDCIISGRGGILHAVNGHDGSSIWEMPLQDFRSFEQQKTLDVYDAKFIADINEDGIGDIVASHAMQSNGIRSSEVVIISGKNGNILHSVTLPDTEQLFTAPQMLVHPDGENIFILATSSQVQSGGLYVIPQVDLMYGNMKLRKLPHGTGKGALLSPILVDVTSDGVEDIIVAMFNSTIMAYNGLTFNPLWNYTIPNSEVISIPIPGYYNDDDVPDFMIKHQIGSGFPTYYYTTATIIDGTNGKPLLEKPIEDSLSRQMSGLSITVNGFGNDWFLHWSADCLNYEGVKEKYQFLKGQSLISQTHADLCKLRFNSTLTTKLLALSQHVGPPGVLLYSSEDWKLLEFNNSIDPRVEMEQYLESHPDFEIMDTYADIPFVSERSPRVHKSRPKASVFNNYKGNNILTKLSQYPKLFDMTYEKINDYKLHDNADISSDSTEDFNANNNWRHTNKWTEKNVQSNKDYDIEYDGDNNDKDDEHDLDYSQEVREQRSDENDNSINILQDDMQEQFDLSTNYISGRNKSNDHYLDESTNKVNVSEILNVNPNLINSTLSMNQTINSKTTSKRKRGISNSSEKIKVLINNTTIVESHVNNVKQNITADKKLQVSNISHTTQSIRMQNNMTYSKKVYVHEQKKIENFSSKSKLVLNRTSTSNNKTFYLKNNIADIAGVNNTVGDSPNKIIEQIHTHIHNFFNNVQNEEDASIEKIFKRESLKNQGDNLKKKLNNSSTITNQYQEKIKKLRVKRKTYTENSQIHMIDGVQRQPPTGILLPSLSKSTGSTSIDLIFSTFWLPSSEISVILLQEDLDCIHKKKAMSENKLQYKDNDDIITECLSERGVNYRAHQEAMSRGNVKIALGQMTVYRMKLECVCPEDMLPTQICKNISFHQSWSEHLGFSGNGYFKPLHKQTT